MNKSTDSLPDLIDPDSPPERMRASLDAVQDACAMLRTAIEIFEMDALDNPSFLAPLDVLDFHRRNPIDVCARLGDIDRMRQQRAQLAVQTDPFGTWVPILSATTRIEGVYAWEAVCDDPNAVHMWTAHCDCVCIANFRQPAKTVIHHACAQHRGDDGAIIASIAAAANRIDSPHPRIVAIRAAVYSD